MMRNTLKLITLAALLTGSALSSSALAEMPAAAKACVGCHGADGNSLSPAFPKLAGQHAQYLETALKAYRDGTRHNDMMNRFAKNLKDEDIKAIAAYFSSQKPKCD